VVHQNGVHQNGVGFTSDNGRGCKNWTWNRSSQLPEGTLDLNGVKNNFQTFDHFTPDGTAISTKTMDTVGAVTYQNPANITRTLNGYVDAMVNFEADGVPNGFQLTNENIVGKGDAAWHPLQHYGRPNGRNCKKRSSTPNARVSRSL